MQPSTNRPVRITVGNLKGGTGKSTTAILLALALARTNKRVLLVDADHANTTAWAWSELAGDAWPANVPVFQWPSQHLSKRIRDAEGTFDHLVIDTGPHDSAILRQALAVTDMLVMPLAPTGNEVERLAPTLAAAAEIGVLRPNLTLAVLLTRTVPRTRSREEVRQVLDGRGLWVLETEVPRREAIAQAFGTVPDDLLTYTDVLNEITREEI